MSRGPRLFVPGTPSEYRDGENRQAQDLSCTDAVCVSPAVQSHICVYCAQLLDYDVKVATDLR